MERKNSRRITVNNKKRDRISYVNFHIKLFD